MDTPAPRQISYYFALIHFSIFMTIECARAYFVIPGDFESERQFGAGTLWLVPLLVFTFFAATILVGNDILESRRLTRRGIASLIMLTPTAVLLAIIVTKSFWEFAVHP